MLCFLFQQTFRNKDWKIAVFVSTSFYFFKHTLRKQCANLPNNLVACVVCLNTIIMRPQMSRPRKTKKVIRISGDGHDE